MTYKLTYLYKTPYEGDTPRWLFVCTSGVLRSPTACVVANELGYNSRSCGVERYSLIPISSNLIYWADKIVFMDQYCYNKAHELFSEHGLLEYFTGQDPYVKIWDIPDSFEYMNPRLVELIKQNLK